MIVFFPELYEDELAYSWFSRYHVHSGHLTFSATARDLFGKVNVIPSPEFVVSLTDEAISMIQHWMPLDTFIERHTMFPQYARFLPIDRRRSALELMIKMDLRFNDPD